MFVRCRQALDSNFADFLALTYSVHNPAMFANHPHKNFDKREALKISFLMSLPIILGANLILNLGVFGASIISFNALAGVLAAFLVGIATIHSLMKLAEKINFGWFVFIIAILTILGGLFLR